MRAEATKTKISWDSKTPLGERNRPADCRLLGPAVGCWLTAAVAVQWKPGVAFVIAAFLLVISAVCLVSGISRPRRWRGKRIGDLRPTLNLRKRFAAPIAVTCALSGAVLACTGAQVSIRQDNSISELASRNASVTIEGRVSEDPKPLRASMNRGGEPRAQLVVKANGMRESSNLLEKLAAPIKVVGPADLIGGLTLGQRVEVTGRLRGTSPGSRTVAFLEAKHVAAQPLPPMLQSIENIRGGLRGASEELNEDARGLLPGLVVGDTSRLPETLRQDMQTTGLTHLTAVSGSNVAVVCGAALLLGAAFGLGRRARVFFAVLALIWFVVLARPDPSVLRAAVMGVIGLIGLVSARKGSGIPALATSVCVLCAVDPWLARSFGFILSVLATGALVLLAPLLVTAFSAWLPRILAQALALPLAAQLVCAPVLILLSPQVSLISVPANLLAGLAVAPATILGVFAALVAIIWPLAAQWCAWLAGWPVSWIAQVAHVGAGVPGAALPWQSGIVGAVGLAGSCGALLAVILAAPALINRWRSYRKRTGRDRVSVGLALLLAGAVVVGILSPPRWLTAMLGSWPPPGWQLVACDVGQGDAVVLKTEPGKAILVDTGPPGADAAKCLRDLEINALDLLVLTHFHLDHIGGLQQVLNSVAVGRVWVSPWRQPAAQVQQTEQALSGRGLVAEIASTGRVETFGPVAVEVVWPEPEHRGTADQGASAQANSASVVILVSTQNMRFLLTGDLEPAAQAEIRTGLSNRSGGCRLDVIKVAHHGSANQNPELYRDCRARVGLISAGKENTYGHPAARTLAMLQEAGIPYARTDESSDIAIGVGEGEFGPIVWVQGRAGRGESVLTSARGVEPNLPRLDENIWSWPVKRRDRAPPQL